jgi:hypothetical protein
MKRSGGDDDQRSAWGASPEKRGALIIAFDSPFLSHTIPGS